MRATRRLRPGLLLLLAALAQPQPGRAAPETGLDLQLDHQLDQLQQQAYEQPEQALQRLQALRNAPEHRGTGPVAQLLMAEGQVLVQAGQAARALGLAGELEAHPGQQERALLLRAMVADSQGQLGEALKLARQSLAGLQPACALDGGPPRLARGCDFRMAWQALRIVHRAQQAQGASAQAQATAREALALAEAGQDHTRTISSLGDLALLAHELEQQEEARRRLQTGLALAEGDPQAMARMKIWEALIGARRGDRGSQKRAFEEALDFARQAGAVHLQALIRTNLTDFYMHTGQPSQALQLAAEALPVLLRHKDQRIERVLRHNMAVALILLRRFEPARHELAYGQVLAASLSDPARRARELREIGEAWAAAGQAREAIAVFHQERRLSAEIDERSRAALLEQLKLKYDSEGEQRDLELLTRDKTLKDQQLANRDLARHVGLALGVLLALSLLLVAVMLKRVHAANRRLKANEQLLRAQSEHDPLTELANRRHFLAVMQQHAKERFEGALLMVDIDHFKHVNDRHGHASGDLVIREVARRIGEAVRAEDLVVRWGGEEFLVFAPDVAQDQLQLLAERILFSVGAEPVPIESGPLPVSVSIGYACFPLPPGRLRLHWEQAVNWADMALYTAKARGRNRAVGIASVEAGDSSALQAIEADFDAACSAHRVALHHIPGPQPR